MGEMPPGGPPALPRMPVADECELQYNALMVAAVTSRTLKDMVKRIVEKFDPDRIILFGSRARGDHRPDSDIDLLVVMPVDGSVRDKRVEIRVALNSMHVAKDIVVVTPDQYRRWRDVPGTIVYPAIQEGRIVYERGERLTRERCAVGSEG